MYWLKLGVKHNFQVITFFLQLSIWCFKLSDEQNKAQYLPYPFNLIDCSVQTENWMYNAGHRLNPEQLSSWVRVKCANKKKKDLELKVVKKQNQVTHIFFVIYSNVLWLLFFIFNDYHTMRIVWIESDYQCWLNDQLIVRLNINRFSDFFAWQKLSVITIFQFHCFIPLRFPMKLEI